MKWNQSSSSSGGKEKVLLGRQEGPTVLFFFSGFSLSSLFGTILSLPPRLGRCAQQGGPQSPQLVHFGPLPEVPAPCTPLLAAVVHMAAYMHALRFATVGSSTAGLVVAARCVH